MTQRELQGAIKAFQYGMLKARESKSYLSQWQTALAGGDNLGAEIKQRQSDMARGEAHGVAQALALIGGTLKEAKYTQSIYHQLGE